MIYTYLLLKQGSRAYHYTECFKKMQFLQFITEELRVIIGLNSKEKHHSH